MQTKIYISLFLAVIALASCKKADVQKSNDSLAAVKTMGTAAAVSPLNRLTFDWQTVPVGADIGDATRDFSTSEISFLTKQFKILAIEKSQGSGYTEDGFLTAANALKASNPQIAVLFYWNSLSFFDKYRATINFNPGWLTPNGNNPNNPPDLRLDIPACRLWWIKTATAITRNPEVDGVFIDGLTTVYKNNSDLALTLLKELRTSLDTLPGTPRIIFYNCAVAKSSKSPIALTDATGTTLHPLLQLADGAWFEDFYRKDLGRNIETGDLVHILNGIKLAASKKKSIVLKAWPQFSFANVDGYASSHTYLDLVARARSEISFPLASFLVAAGRYSYFQYSWAWNHTSPNTDHGIFIRTAANAQTVDPTWYVELRRPLGQPAGDATINGNIWTRRFSHATVTVDLNQKTGYVSWDILNFFPRG
jgi:hypothetical protein